MWGLQVVSSPLSMNIHFHLTYFPDCIQTGISLNFIVCIRWWFWPGLYFKKFWSLSQKSLSCFRICHIKKEEPVENANRHLFYSLIWDQKANQLTRRGCWGFSFSPNAFHTAWQTGSESLRVESIKYWHLWGHPNLLGSSGGERGGVHRQENGLVRVITSQ